MLVHLGNSRCDHLWTNVKRLCNIWPDLNIWIILDGNANIEIAKALNLNVFDYRGFNQSIAKKTGDHAFRNGFWNLTTERIFALFRFQEKNPFYSILHIENDVLLFRNFPYEYFERIQLNAWMKVSEDHDSAAIIFLPDLSSTRWLESEFHRITQEDGSLTDMRILSRVRVDNSTKVHLLPTLESHSDTSNGFFDPASIGMWLTGEEPRNNFGITRRFNNRFDLEVLRKSTPPFKLDEGCLKILNSRFTPIYNLHIHSKNKKFLGVDAETELRFMLKPISKYILRYNFSLRILIEVIKDYRRRGKLLSLIAALPGIRILRDLLLSKVGRN